MQTGVPHVGVEIYLATLNSAQVIMLAWIGSEAAAARRERRQEQRKTQRPED